MGPRRSPRIRLACLSCALVVGGLGTDVVAAAPAASGSTRRTAVDLEPDGGGRLRHRGAGFTAIIYPDGSVEFRDHGAAADIEIFGLDLRRRRFREPEPERHAPWWSGLLYESLYPRRQSLGPAPIFAGFGVRFGGLADGPRKSRHRSAKQAFLAATEALRFRLANAWYKQRLQAELADLGDQLLAVWRDTGLPLAERKRRIFERWAECEDPDTARRTELDNMRLEVARTARAKIEAFVREVAPYGSADAYTEAELDRLNASRAGKARFRPYDAPVRPEDVQAERELGTSIAAPPAREPPPRGGRPGG